MAVRMEEARGRILEAYTLCDADCEHGYHNPRFERCDRCGSLIHVRVYRVETVAGEEMTVGSECFRDVMGFKVGTWHIRALEVVKKLQKWYACEFFREKTIRVTYEKSVLVGPVYYKGNLGSYIQRIPYKMSDSLIRAGIDLGLWTRAHWDEKLLIMLEGIEKADMMLEALEEVVKNG